jgi:hypothetical protein
MRLIKYGYHTQKGKFGYVKRVKQVMSVYAEYCVAV